MSALQSEQITERPVSGHMSYDKLTESQKIKRCIHFARASNIPQNIRENSGKEELTLEHVKDFERKFRMTYPECNKELLLYPKNECGVEKIICATIRPTLAPFPELYEAKQCAEFISTFLEYEELDIPNKFPAIIPSPANVLNWQKGDCFDLTIVLCSFLIGAGYDAYCVTGRAPREITQADESLLECPIQAIEQITQELEEQKKQVQKQNEFAIEPKPPLISKYEKDTKLRIYNEEEEKKRKENTIDDDCPELRGYDKWAGQRVHCWILVREGQRQVQEPMFLEPTTGRCYSISESPYESIDQLWNHKNTWINLEDAWPRNFDFREACWEFLMLDDLPQDRHKKLTTSMSKENGEDQEEDEVLEEENQEEKVKDVIDMPPPWSPKLRIDRDKFALRCPFGEKTKFYKKIKVDQYAPYTQCDGLVMRLTFYDDFKMHIVNEIRSYYAQRRDKLWLRRRFPYEYKTIEEFLPGHSYQLKQIIEVEGESRIIHYYPNRQDDGLIYREERIGVKTIEQYDNSDSPVVYRSWKFNSEKSAGPKDYTIKDIQLDKDCVITKLVQKQKKDPNAPWGKSIYKLILDQDNNKITVNYHYEPGQVTAQSRSFQIEKDPKQQEDQHLTHEQLLQQQQENDRILEMVKLCHTTIKSHEINLGDELKKVKDEEEKIATFKQSHDINAALKNVINKSIYDKAREKNKEVVKIPEEEERQDGVVTDYLTPILEAKQLQNRELTAEEALDVKNEAMNKLRDRLLNRADIIAKSLEEENRKLEEAKMQFTRKGEHISAQDQAAFDELVAQCQFRIEILEQRALRHEEMALERFTKMDQELMNHPKLQALRNIEKN